MNSSIGAYYSPNPVRPISPTDPLHQPLQKKSVNGLGQSPDGATVMGLLVLLVLGAATYKAMKG